MKIPPRRLGRFLLAVSLALFAAGCLFKEEPLSRRGSEVENEFGLYGRLVDESGGRMEGAMVKALPYGGVRTPDSGIGRAAAESTLTGEDGTYRFESLQPGEYQIVGDYRKGALVVLIPGVLYADTALAQNVGEDTLRSPGGIRAGVRINGSGKAEVICYLPGTSYLAITDDSGSCVLSGVPQGTYTMRYSLPGYSIGGDTGVHVTSGLMTDLPFKNLSLDTALNPPAPAGLRASYDTVTGVARLSWPPVRVGDLDGYLVYRDEGSGSPPVQITPKLVRDTAYADTLTPLLLNLLPRTVYYRIKSVDRGANPSLSFSAPVSISALHPKMVLTVLSPKSKEALNTSIAIGDSLIMTARYANPTKRIRSVAWYLNGSAEPIAVREKSEIIGTDTLRFALHSLGAHNLLCIATDESGRKAGLEFKVQVIQDVAPEGAVKLYSASVGDSVHLNGQDFAKNRTGIPPLITWDIGATGSFLPSRNGLFSFRVPDVDTILTCIVNLLYSDGVKREYSVTVVVASDPPLARVTAPSEAFLGDTLFASASESTDGYGKVVKWEWDFGNKGTFLEAGPEISFTAPSQPDPEYVSVLRVTDDDGKTGTQEFRVAVRERTGWIRRVKGGFLSTVEYHLFQEGRANKAVILAKSGISEPDPFWQRWSSEDLVHWKQEGTTNLSTDWQAVSFGSPILTVGGVNWVLLHDQQTGLQVLAKSSDGDTWDRVPLPDTLANRSEIGFLKFQDKLWIIGGVAGGEILEDVWSSSNGTNWTRATAKAGFGKRIVTNPVEHAGKMWFYGGWLNGGPVNDCWSSADGAIWTRASAAAISPMKENFVMKAFRGKLWLMSGVDENIYDHTIWNSVNGIQWEKAGVDPGYLDFGWNSVVVAGGNMALLRVSSQYQSGRGIGDVWIAPY